MNLKQMEVFLAVAETNSFSRGAERTFLTQSTVSQHISALENEFGIKLLDRTGKGAYPTEAGKIFINHVRQILAGISEANAVMLRYKGLEQVVLRIGGSNIPGNYLIPRFLPLFLKMHEDAEVHLIQGDSREVLRKLKDEEIELAFTGTLFSDDTIDFKPLASDNIILVVYPNHKWTKRGEISIEELRDESFVFREEGSGTQGAVCAALANDGINPSSLNVRARLGSNEAVKQAVSYGLGISFLSELSIGEACLRGELFPVKINGFAISRNFYIAARSGRELSPAAKEFSNKISDWLRQSKTVADRS
jgi:DNA-binding transcriptional LysR family regulator